MAITLFGDEPNFYLFPLRNARFLQPVIDGLRALTPADFGADRQGNIAADLVELRRAVRETLRWDQAGAGEALHQGVRELIDAARVIRRGVIAVAMKQLPLFLVPAPGIEVGELPDRVEARIRWDNTSSYLDDVDNRRLFSFDLPMVLFDQYATHGVLSARAALNLKEDMLARLQATVFIGDQARVIEFELDHEWIGQVRARIEERRGRRRE